MTRVGIRELRQKASQYLRRVEAGETIEVTDRGRPVALLTPIPEASRLEQLRAAGDVGPAEGDLEDLGPPLEPALGQELPSSVLSRLRADER
jgi:prevent-host-death family protein